MKIFYDLLSSFTRNFSFFTPVFDPRTYKFTQLELQNSPFTTAANYILQLQKL